MVFQYFYQAFTSVEIIHVCDGDAVVFRVATCLSDCCNGGVVRVLGILISHRIGIFREVGVHQIELTGIHADCDMAPLNLPSQKNAVIH